MLQKIIDNDWLEARGIVGFYPANTVDVEDIEVYSDDTRIQSLCKLPHIETAIRQRLRQFRVNGRLHRS